MVPPKDPSKVPQRHPQTSSNGLSWIRQHCRCPQTCDTKTLQRFFTDVPLDELERPREINLLISHREGQLAPQRIKAVGDLVLWDGPLEKTVGGTHPELFEEVTVTAHMSKTHFARSMRMAAKYEELTGKVTEQPLPNTQLTPQLQESSTSVAK